MGIDAVSRVDVADLPLNVRARAPVQVSHFPSRETAIGSLDLRPAPPDARPVAHNGQDAAELSIESKPRVASDGGPIESYAKIRYDENTNTVLIQIVNSASGEVMREIPPGAWNKVREGIPLPKGTLVEKEQ